MSLLGRVRDTQEWRDGLAGRDLLEQALKGLLGHHPEHTIPSIRTVKYSVEKSIFIKGEVTMLRCPLAVPGSCAAILLSVLSLRAVPFVGPAEALKQKGTVAGVVIDKRDTWMAVKADGENQPVKYVLPGHPDESLRKAWESIFTAGRVQLTYQVKEETRKLVRLRRQVLQDKGWAQGVVVHNYGWWIEVKLPNGISDGFAANFPFDKNKAMMDKLKELEEGDVVTIGFTTDGERHRIQALQKIGTTKKKGIIRDFRIVTGMCSFVPM